MDFVGVEPNRLSRTLYALAQDAHDCLGEHAINVSGQLGARLHEAHLS